MVDEAHPPGRDRPFSPRPPRRPGTLRSCELTTVADDEAVVHDGVTVRVHADLAPDTAYELDGFSFRTLPRPGKPLARFATVNDVHFGETECGSSPVGTSARSTAAPGAAPTRGDEPGAVADIAAVEPTVGSRATSPARGTVEEYQAFLDCWAPASVTASTTGGNHDGYHGETFARGAAAGGLPGVRLALLDTTVPCTHRARVDAAQLEWLGDIAARATCR